MEVNEHILSISGKASTQEPLELGQDYRVTIEGTITSQTDVDNDNGTKNRINKLKPRLVEEIVHKGRVIKVKDKSSTSQKNRARHFIWQQEWLEPDVKMDYDRAGELIRKYYDDIMDLVVNKEYGSR
jgi:hypothetical protein